MVRILTEMIEAGEPISARAVAKRHPSISHASSITRNPARSDLLASYQALQSQFRSWQKRAQKGSGEKLAGALAAKDQRIKELEGQVSALQVAVLALVKSVGELGGVNGFLRFFDGYRDVRRVLTDLQVISEAGAREINPIDQP